MGIFEVLLKHDEKNFGKIDIGVKYTLLELLASFFTLHFFNFTTMNDMINLKDSDVMHKSLVGIIYYSA